MSESRALVRNYLYIMASTAVIIAISIIQQLKFVSARLCVMRTTCPKIPTLVVSFLMC